MIGKRYSHPRSVGRGKDVWTHCDREESPRAPSGSVPAPHVRGAWCRAHLSPFIASGGDHGLWEGYRRDDAVEKTPLTWAITPHGLGLCCHVAVTSYPQERTERSEHSD